jgi:hypothetical protein
MLLILGLDNVFCKQGPTARINLNDTQTDSVKDVSGMVTGK